MAQITVQQAITQAMRLHDAGQFAQAEQLYRLALAQQPDQPDALAGLGAIAHVAGHHEAAVELIGKAIARQRGSFTFYNDLASALKALGRLPEAIAAYRSAINMRPNSVELWNNLAIALTLADQPDEAIQACEHAIGLNSRLAEPYFNLGEARRMKGLLDEAIEAYRTAIRLRENFPHAHRSLGIALAQSGRIEQAIDAYRGAERAGDHSADLHFLLGDALHNLRRIDEAIEAYRAVIAVQPDLAEAYDNLAGCLNLQSKFMEAEAACRTSIGLKPERLASYLNLGNSLYQQGRLEEAVDACRHAVRLGPEHAESYLNLGQSLVEQGWVAEGIDAFRDGSQRTNAFPLVHQGLLMSMHYQPGTCPDELFREHLRFAEIYATPLAKLIKPHANDRSPDRRLRVGYVSGDFRTHSVSRFVPEIFKNHDRTRFEVFGYSLNAKNDEVTEELRASCDQWRAISDRSNEEAAAIIAADQIDILVDLGGHSGGNRLLIFALKPAPVQVTYLGYPDTTGLATINYRITDGLADPPGTIEQWHTETLVRLPRTAWCFAAPESSPLVAPQPPSLQCGHVTFGSFNAVAKLSDDCIELWSNILHAVPGSRIFLKNKSLGDEATADRLRAAFAGHGIEASRLDLLGLQPSHATHLAHYDRLDIALDPFPYHGTTTTCEALWMGVPVITLAGNAHVSRVGVSLLSNVGLTDLVAQTPDEYVRIATALAGDSGKLRDLRNSLRGRMEISALMNGAQFTSDLETAYRRMWRTWCGQSD